LWFKAALQETFMKPFTFRSVVLTGALAAGFASAASAMSRDALPKNTEWCAIYRSGSENCHFYSMQQCNNSVSGLGGFCQPSYYAPDARRG
jgi:hypothetical protein